MRKAVCAFANHHMAKGAPRYLAQAESMNTFDDIYIYNQKDIDSDFKKKFGRYMFPYAKGYAYWCWKPYIIEKTLNKMEEGDLLLYTDLGCFLNSKGRERLQDYFDIVAKTPTGILGFQSKEKSYNDLPETIYYEYEWTKGDVFDYFGVRDDKSITDTTQIEATIIFFRKCPQVMAFIAEWRKAIDDDYFLLTDDPSHSPNLPGFKENRYDQSLFSILGKLHHIETLSTNETFQRDWSLLDNYPIQARRDKAYPSKLHYRLRFKIRDMYRFLWKIKYLFR